MKIRIEGCTEKELAEHADYLSLGKVYEATYEPGTDSLYVVGDDVGGKVYTLIGCETSATSHLPKDARWVEVPDAQA